MELRVLRYFLVVAQEGAVTKAADALHITQPTLSRQLMQLEEELGVRLFERDRRGLKLTQDGLLLKRRAQEMLELAEQTKQDLSHNDEVLSGRIALSCGEMAAMEKVGEWTAEFHRLHPQVSFDIYTSSADEIKERLDRGIADLGLLCEPVDISPYEYIRMPQRDIWGAFFRSGCPLEALEYVTPSDLLHYPLIVTRRDIVRSELSHWFGPLYDQLQIAATFNLGNNALVLAKSGVGVVISFKQPSLNLEHSLDWLHFRPLKPQLDTGSVLVWKKHQPLSPAVENFISYIRECLEQFDAK